MGATDYLLEGLAAAVQGFERGYLPFAKAKFEDELATRRQTRQRADELSMYQQKLDMEDPYLRRRQAEKEASQLRVANAAQNFVVDEDGNLVQTYGRGHVTKLAPPKVEKSVAGMNSGQQSAVFKLADDYEKASGDFSKIVGSYNRIRKSAKNPTAAGDLALIFNYMKMLDPGSVVREGEFATAQNSGSVPDVIQAKYNKVLKGERLSDDIRKDFLERSKMLYEGAGSQQEQVNNQFKERAIKFGVDPSLVIRNQSVYEEKDDVLPAVLSTGATGKIALTGDKAKRLQMLREKAKQGTLK